MSELKIGSRVRMLPQSYDKNSGEYVGTIIGETEDSACVGLERWYVRWDNMISCPPKDIIVDEIAERDK